MIRKQITRNRRSSGNYSTALLLVWIILAWPIPGLSQNLRSHEEAARVVTVADVKVVDGVVSGQVWNRSSHLLRDVQLFIRYTWLWDDERHPGKIDPGTSTYYPLPREIAPGAKAPFTFSPTPSLPKIGGGRFETTVSVAGFTEVIPQ
jgi:hypothetical protein